MINKEGDEFLGGEERDRQRVNASEERRKVGEPVFLGEMLSEKEAAPRLVAVNTSIQRWSSYS